MKVVVRNKGACIEIDVANYDTILGDIRGVFFNLGNSFDASSSNIDKTTIAITSWKGNDGTSVGLPFDVIKTVFQCNKDGLFPLISPNAQMKGGGGARGSGGRVYNCAVEVRMRTTRTACSTIMVLLHIHANLTLSPLLILTLLLRSEQKAKVWKISNP